MKIQQLLVLCIGLLIILAGCGGDEIKDPVFPNPINERQTQEAPTRPSEDTTGSEIDSPQYPDGTTVIVAIGDSITYGIRSPIGGYPVILQSKLTAAGYNVVVINEGVPGQTSPETLAHFLEVIAGADIALIMIGTNDLINPGGCPEPFDCKTIENTEKMLDKALISKTIPIVSTVTPARSDGIYAWANYRIEMHNSLIYDIAAERNVVVVDNYNAILNNGGNTLYEDNKVHFTDQGYEVIAQEWFNAIVDNNFIEASHQK